VFAVLAGYRERLIATHCSYGCPLGRLALEVDPENRPAHDLIAANFTAWKRAVRTFLDEAKDRLPSDLDRDGLATLVLTVMEGGVMQTRASGTLDPFDRSVSQLRDYFVRLGAIRSTRRITSRRRAVSRRVSSSRTRTRRRKS